MDPILRWTGMKNYNPSWDIPVLNLTVNYDVEMFSTTATLGAIEAPSFGFLNKVSVLRILTTLYLPKSDHQ